MNNKKVSIHILIKKISQQDGDLNNFLRKNERKIRNLSTENGE